LGNIIGVLLLIVTIALNLLAGMRASQRTGRVGTGALAGMIMQLINLVFGVILILTRIFVFDPTLHQILSHAPSELDQQFIMMYSISFLVILLLGTVLGAIGGLLGRKRAQLPLYV
jgi:predicted cobalt transporter CbtA